MLIISNRKTCLLNQTLQPPCLPKLYHFEVLYMEYCLLLSPVSTSFVCVSATVHRQPYCFCFKHRREPLQSLFVMLYSTYVPAITVSTLPQTTVLCYTTVVKICPPVLTVGALVDQEMDIHSARPIHISRLSESRACCAYATSSLQRCSGSTHLVL